MSSGAIDDSLGSLPELLRLRWNFPDFDTYLRRFEEIFSRLDATTDVPFLGGITSDGEIPLIDRHFRRFITPFFDCARPIVKHEVTEWGLRKFCRIGVDYSHDSRGHRLANRAEIESLPDWLTREAYDSWTDPQIKGIEHERITLINPNLALYPYRNTPILAHLKSLGATDAS